MEVNGKLDLWLMPWSCQHQGLVLRLKLRHRPFKDAVAFLVDDTLVFKTGLWLRTKRVRSVWSPTFISRYTL